MLLVPTTFPRARRGALGYRIAEVDEFLAAARAAYDSRPPSADLTAERIRRTAFGMQRGGYRTAAVDAALERLEDAFAQRERTAAVRSTGERAWISDSRQLAKELIARLSRPRRSRFRRTGLLGTGYSVPEVDRFAERTREYFEAGSDLTVEEVRAVAFRAKRHGYSERQVDLVIDGVVEVMLAVR